MSAISAVALRRGRWCRWSADHRHRTSSLWATTCVFTVLCACGGESPPRPVALARIEATRPAPAEEVVEVWVCDVPVNTADPRYGDMALRLDLTPQDVIDRVADGVNAYFADISHGTYRLRFRPGGSVTMRATDDAPSCLAAALDASSDAATTVLAVANAEHAADQPGGFGSPGSWFDCAGSCPARISRRGAYVGASDFSPQWDEAPRDLIEHELGHTLGLPHSGIGPDGSYESALDLMSDSAAPRELVADGPTPLDAPDTIGINRVALGWLPASDVVVVRDADVAVLHPSTSASGVRLAVVALDEHRLLTIELLVPSGHDAHLTHAGVALHVVDDGTGDREARTQNPVGPTAPFLDLMTAGEATDVDGWRVSVTAIEGDPLVARVAVARTNG